MSKQPGHQQASRCVFQVPSPGSLARRTRSRRDTSYPPASLLDSLEMGHKRMICQYYASLVHTPAYLRSWKLLTFQCAAKQRAEKPLVNWELTSTSPCCSSFGTILSLGIGAQRSFFVKFHFNWFNSVFLLEEDLVKQTKHLTNVNIHN